ncbi:Mediator of RNA polymerase II transcription subunit 16 [Eumeta japonica]|uniref:Mediator of RNA polymerase II transcription subunit 16 n=1 Tax=Eumeta variegata TaxID=151549 RepID=A0A4C1ZEK9_EUMVA|nr:Mediator of RNA polymerase II transcription subunit 16 [Eumeta japonica]
MIFEAHGRSDPEVVKPICTISSANIIAFSSTTKLSDFDGDSWGGHVYICDLDTPWDSHHVTSTQSPITALEWDCEGKHLLVATSVGDVSVFGQRDYLLNDWMCLYTASFPGEFICKAILFHNGRRVVSVDKKVDSSATEKLQISRLTPTLRGFGNALVTPMALPVFMGGGDHLFFSDLHAPRSAIMGIACEGACVVTSTGLLCALVPPVTTSSEPPAGPSRTQTSILPPPQALTTMECLRATRDHIVAASFAHKNGNLLIATVCASPAINNMGSGRCVRCHLGSVRRSTTPAHAPHLAVQPLPSLYVTDDPGLPPSISWCIHEDGDCLLIGGAVLSLWKLMERAHHVHKLLAKGPVPGNTTSSGVQKPLDCFNTLAWQQMAIWSWETIGSGGGGGNAVCVSALRPSPPRALVATSRGVHLLYRDKLTHICSKQVVAGGGDILPVGTAAPKKAKYGTVIMNGSCATLCCVETSWNGGVAVVLDTHSQLHVYKVVQPCPDIPSPLYVQHFANGLEYALVAGYDYLDLLLALKPAAREPLYDRMTEWLSRQPVAFRQFYQSAWLNLRAALCRLMPNGQTRASELTSLQTLHSIWACVEAAVRPTELGEKGPLEALQSLLEDQPAAHIDLDKILVSLDAKELSCEPGTVCALRRVLERAADIALSLLAALSQHNLVLPSGQLHHHG